MKKSNKNGKSMQKGTVSDMSVVFDEEKDGFWVQVLVRPPIEWLSETKIRIRLAQCLRLVAEGALPKDLFDLKVSTGGIQINLDLGRKKTTDELGWLCYHYDQALPEWQEAKRIFKQATRAKQASRKTNWRDEIKAIYPHLPEDLMEKLQLQGDSKACDLALLDAVRRCDIKAPPPSLQTLYARLRKQRKEGVIYRVENGDLE